MMWADLEAAMVVFGFAHCRRRGGSEHTFTPVTLDDPKILLHDEHGA